jgi:hypothetical protein
MAIEMASEACVLFVFIKLVYMHTTIDNNNVWSIQNRNGNELYWVITIIHSEFRFSKLLF